MEATMKIEVLDKAAIPLLEDMAQRHLLRIEPEIKECRRWQSVMKPSEYFAGRLRLTDAQYEAFQQELTNTRNEWDRAIS
jgi:hypothetical protein